MSLGPDDWLAEVAFYFNTPFDDKLVDHLLGLYSEGFSISYAVSEVTKIRRLTCQDEQVVPQDGGDK